MVRPARTGRDARRGHRNGSETSATSQVGEPGAPPLNHAAACTAGAPIGLRAQGCLCRKSGLLGGVRFPLRFQPVHVVRACRAASAALLVVFAGPLPIRGADDEPSVVVNLAEERLAYRTYPPGQPPRDIAHAENQTVAGYCDTEFVHRCRIAYTHRRDGGPATITQVRIDSSLTVTIWTEEGSGPGVRHHEEAHRAIAKHYYALTRSVGETLARRLVGQTVSVPGAEDRRELPALDAIQDRLLDDLSVATTARNRVAQAKFDALTYGQPDTIIAQAMHRALAEEAAEHAAALHAQPARRPTPPARP